VIFLLFLQAYSIMAEIVPLSFPLETWCGE
jgi:hypothetical protein